MTTSGSGTSQPAFGRLVNGDSFLADDRLGLYVVCDGEGDETCSETASRLAVRTVSEFIESETDRGHLVSDKLATRAIQRAVAAVETAEETDPKLAGMTTTLTMLLVQGSRAVVGHVGDSRLYLIRDQKLHLLTVDHALTQATEGNPALVEHIALDTFRLLVRPDDTFLLSTDGLNAALEDASWVVNAASHRDLGRLADTLLQRARQLGETDDATIVIVRLEEDETGSRVHHYSYRDMALSWFMPAATGA